MTKSLTNLISKSLLLPDDAAVYEVSQRLAETFPDSYVLETEDYDFDPSTYAEDGRCHIEPLDSTHAQIQVNWLRMERHAELETRNAFCEVLWRGKRLHYLSLIYGTSKTKRHHVIADQPADAHAFFEAVCAWNAEPHDEIMVFGGNNWRKDKALKEQIGKASFDTLVLAEGMADELIADFESFFASKELYEEIGVAWKRGVLLLGPPGNGKTHFIKAIVNRVGKPCLYVRSFKPCRGTVQQAISAVFAKARASAPCILIFEDLDSLIDDTSRSYFLNEMDGFAENSGVLSIATTNHPHKLDPALLERPSRFDRKFTFALPAKAERRRFLLRDNERRKDPARLSNEELDEIAALTEDFSFAYLKELGLSALMVWVRNPVPGQLGSIMRGQVETLRMQMRTERHAKAPKVEEEDDDD